MQRNLLQGGGSLVQDVEGLPAHTAPPVVPDDARPQSSLATIIATKSSRGVAYRLCVLCGYAVKMQE